MLASAITDTFGCVSSTAVSNEPHGLATFRPPLPVCVAVRRSVRIRVSAAHKSIAALARVTRFGLWCQWAHEPTHAPRHALPQSRSLPSVSRSLPLSLSLSLLLAPCSWSLSPPAPSQPPRHSFTHPFLTLARSTMLARFSLSALFAFVVALVAFTDRANATFSQGTIDLTRDSVLQYSTDKWSSTEAFCKSFRSACVKYVRHPGPSSLVSVHPDARLSPAGRPHRRERQPPPARRESARPLGNAARAR